MFFLHIFPFNEIPGHSWAQNRPAFYTSPHLHGAASAVTALLSRGTGWAAERANMPLMEPFLGPDVFRMVNYKCGCCSSKKLGG